MKYPDPLGSKVQDFIGSQTYNFTCHTFFNKSREFTVYGKHNVIYKYLDSTRFQIFQACLIYYGCTNILILSNILYFVLISQTISITTKYY